MDQLTQDVRRVNWFNNKTECKQRPVNVSVKQSRYRIIECRESCWVKKAETIS